MFPGGGFDDFIPTGYRIYWEYRSRVIIVKAFIFYMRVVIRIYEKHTGVFGPLPCTCTPPKSVLNPYRCMYVAVQLNGDKTRH